MLYLLLGPDGFGKREYINALCAEKKAEAVYFNDEENLPLAEELTQQDLFSLPKVFVLKALLGKYGGPGLAEKFIASKNYIIFAELKLDKRSSENKKLLANKNIEVKQFELPHGSELNGWIEQRSKFYNGQISSEAAEALAVALGRDNAKETKFGGKVVDVEEVYNLWQADSELQKLIAFSNGKEITPVEVKELVGQNGEVDVFDLTNAIADSQKQKAWDLLARFLSGKTGADEKGAVIQLNALLAEQFRNVAAVQDFLVHKKSESEILELTGWKSGRLFVMKKIAGKFPQKKVLDFLNKLSALDEEMKTSSTPPRVLLDLIISQLF